MCSSPLSLLSPNGRCLWRLVIPSGNDSSPPSLYCSDLLSSSPPTLSHPYPLLGFSSPIGIPLAIYWTETEQPEGKNGEDNEEEKEGRRMMVMLDSHPSSGGGGGGTVISQRLIKLDYRRREARWAGPVHRQYGTSIGQVLSVVLGSTNCAIVGMETTDETDDDQEPDQPQRNRAPLLLCLPRHPSSPSWPSELSLAGFSPSIVPPQSFAHSLFFLSRPMNNGRDVEPRGEAEKLFFLGRDRINGRLLAVPVCPLSSALPFRLLSTFHPSSSSLPSSGSVRLCQCGGRVAGALFRADSGTSGAWSLAHLDTETLRWEGPVAEWKKSGRGRGGEDEEEDEDEGRMEVMVSQDGGVMAMLRTTEGAEMKEIRCFRLPLLRPHSAVPSLSDCVLLSLQCASARSSLRDAGAHLAIQLGMLASGH